MKDITHHKHYAGTAMIINPRYGGQYIIVSDSNESLEAIWKRLGLKEAIDFERNRKVIVIAKEDLA